ncbi:hypothetical protein [Pseudomonas coronafaciens]|uniref:hypothetical protein n=1 Tax=Pseudomonas coronafaciens TaxID=53409 RepID=UPI001604A4D4|nr:hypothetical protein [Pseudomonas coronafaciens]
MPQSASYTRFLTVGVLRLQIKINEIKRLMVYCTLGTGLAVELAQHVHQEVKK